MATASSSRDRIRGIAVWGICSLGALALGTSALDLGAYGLVHFLNSDFLTPYFFCLDLLTGHYPLTGWTLSASPFFVPDLTLMAALLRLFGPNGFAYVFFVLIYYLSLTALMGGCIKAVVGRAGPAFLLSLLFGNTFLALRFLPGHAVYLWCIGAPFCHGGIFLLGFAYLWVVSAGLRREKIAALSAGLLILALIGLISDTLLLFQVLLPISIALFLLRNRYAGFGRWFKWQSGCVLGALIGWQIFKLLCLWQSWFYFIRILRIAPTPSHEEHAMNQFFSALPFLLKHTWAFVLLAVLAAAIFLVLKSPSAGRGENAATNVDRGLVDFYKIFTIASLLLTLPLPVLSCLWRDENTVRYLWNWFVFPGFYVALMAAVKVSREHSRVWLAATTAVFFVCLGCATARLSREPLRFPYPDDVAKLDAVLQRRGMKFGLADYWNAKYVNALSRAGLELRQLRPNGDLYFWDNNAFGYYEGTSEGGLRWPVYDYILTDRLDERALARVFGEPTERESAGHYHIWIYSEPGQQRIQQLLEPIVRQKLGPKRLRYLNPN